MTPQGLGRRGIRAEIIIVLALSLGASALTSLLSLLAKLTAPTPLGEQTTSINAATSPREWVDFANQFLGNALALAPVALVLYLLWHPGRSGFRAVGLTLRGPGVSPGRDLGRALALLALIGVPGIALYAAGRALGATVAVVPAPSEHYWWTIPMLLFAAARAALEEEVIVIGYLFTRLRELGYGVWTIILGAALLRGTYHLYQGFGPFIGNVIMGIAFGWCYTRWGRVMPLVIAHFLMDVVAFVGYPLALGWWPELFAG